jgi:hypothetical protein
MTGVLTLLVAFLALSLAAYGLASLNTWWQRRREEASELDAGWRLAAEHAAYLNALKALASKPGDQALVAAAMRTGHVYVSHSTAAAVPVDGDFPPGMAQMMANATSAAVVKRDVESAMRGEIPRHMLK